MTDFRNLPGPGDPETWPACNGDPMDPRTPDALLDSECDPEQLCERYGERELAEMYQAEALEANYLRARLRKAEADAARWHEVSRHGPAPMQFVTDRLDLGVFTRNGVDADRAVDAAIARRKAQEAEQAALRG